MKQNSLLQYIILYVIVACVALAIAALARMFTVSVGFDGFTAFIVFIVALAVQVAVYLSIHVVLQNTMLPWIGEWLSKIPYFRKKIESRQVSDTEEPIEVGVEEIVEENVVQEEEQEEVEIESDVLPPTPEQPSLEDIRKEQLQNRTREQEEKQNIVLNYTRKSFALYLSDEHLDILCRNVLLYIANANMDELKSVKVKKLTVVDLRHFGWNIWNFFKPRGQEEISNFLKTVFPDVFRETEVKSIKRHLKDDELKGIIKIEEELL
jgi:hypothetical protein